jgi:hydroxymethylbilane synthase
VHSLKDVPTALPVGLSLCAYLERADPRDALLSNSGKRLESLPAGARVGTTSLRRSSQVKAMRPDLHVDDLRGNVDTRIRRLRERHYDAIILAMAGLKRANLFDENEMTPIPPEEMLPAAGQGALSIQCHRDQERIRAMLAALNDPQTKTCVQMERAIVAALQGDCHSPIAAWAREADGELLLEAAVGGRDGRPPVVRACASGQLDNMQMLVDDVVDQLQERGALKLLSGEIGA